MRATCINLAIALCISSCGGSGAGSGSDGTEIEGTLTQVAAGSRCTSIPKQTSDARIEGVRICILGQCSVTDSAGQWSVNIDNFPGGEFLIAVDGRGISTAASTSVPAGALGIWLSLCRDDNLITVDSLSYGSMG